VYVLGSDTPFLEPEEAHTPYFVYRAVERFARLVGSVVVIDAVAMPVVSLENVPECEVVNWSAPFI
jgi:hypothetical protein